ncbi:MAG: deoxyribose-phosphate aldolase [Planctomycetia bacterium]|nr:deoxyribose-phosphate aldolase [Planctomycetia bacterium]
MENKTARELSVEEFASMMDVSAVQAQSTWEDAENVMRVADEYDGSCIFLLGRLTELAAPRLKEMNERRKAQGKRTIHLGSVIGFPDGGTLTDVKVYEAKRLLEIGCDEVDCVMNVGLARSNRWDEVEADLRAIRAATEGKILKVILETPYLTDDQIAVGAEICANIGANFVKSSTGWPEKKTTVENIALMKKTVGERCRVKAAGGVRTLETLFAMYDAGATTFGISWATVVKLLDELRAQRTPS